MSNVFQAHLECPSEDLDLTGFQVYEMRGREVISQPFHFTVRSIVPFDQTPEIGLLEGATLTFVMQGRGHLRKIHAMVTGVSIERDLQAKMNRVTLQLGPRLWRSSLVTMQEVYLKTSVPDIIADKLERVQLARDTDVFLGLGGTYAEREFVVQWRESDLAFISRLAEHLGIAYYFNHTDHIDELHFVDEAASFPHLELDLLVREEGTEEGVFRLTRHRTPVAAFYTAVDYNYQHPETPVFGEHPLPEGFAGAFVDYGPHVGDPGGATKIAQLRAEEQHSRRDVITAHSNVLAIAAGHRGELQIEGVGNESVLFTEVEHEATLSAVLQGTGGAGPSYECHFKAIAADVAYRPPRLTPKPLISGLLHGTVVNGPTGIERYAKIDDVGRYWVRLMFDPNPNPTHPSVVTRFLQPHSGPNYGTHFPLKPGIEVLIGFENGDPDRPLIVGSVPNAQTPSPVNAGINTQNRIVTRSGITLDFEDGVGDEVW